MPSTLLLLPFCLFGLALASEDLGQADEVHSLPGIDFPLDFRHFSGYLKSLDGNNLHYWLFESKANVEKDPLILWLNGGPGGSSMFSALVETGPFLLSSEDGRLRKNEHSWINNASMLYLDSPATVGYSYNEHGNLTCGDDYTSEVTYAALVDLFNKFPRLRSCPFYVMGESYAGILVPTLATLVHRRKLVQNFAGIAVGNGLHDWKIKENAGYPFANYHGFVDTHNWANLMKECCAGIDNVQDCDFAKTTTVGCVYAKLSTMQMWLTAQLNPYNIYADCYPNIDNASMAIPLEGGIPLTQKYADAPLAAWANVPDGSNLRSVVPCENFVQIRRYFRRPDVRKALHIRPVSPVWKEISLQVLNTHVRKYVTVKPAYEELLGAGLRVLIFHGDVDAVCNFISGQWFVESLGKELSEPYAVWFLDNQVAGMRKVYGEQQQLVFTTIRGAGHMVPGDKPKVALEMLNKFVNKDF